MIGWELPPHNSGGLGVACAGITQALAADGVDIDFTLPYSFQEQFNHLKVIQCYDPKWFQARSSHKQPPFSVYNPIPPSAMTDDLELNACQPCSQMEKQAEEYAQKVFEFAKEHLDDFDLVHAHDWMTMPAAIKIKQELNKPFVAHIHSTEYDRSLTHDHQTYIGQCEISGMKLADRVIAVSYYTKRILVEKYQITPSKIDVVHNGVVSLLRDINDVPKEFAYRRPVVVFMGRLTIQKGPDYFLDLAGKILEKRKDVLFIVSGMGDMYQQLLLTNAGKNLSANVLFSGFVRGGAQLAILKRADVFVMPSVSEPFGLVAAEAATFGTPVVASKNSGVVEVMKDSPQFNFWDTQAMADEILHLVDDPDYHAQVVKAQLKHLKKTTWKKAAKKIEKIYQKIIKKK